MAWFQGSTGPHFGEPTVLDYLRALSRRRWMVIGVALACLAISVVVSFTMTPRYQVESRISAGKENPDLLGFKDAHSAPLDESEYNMELDAQVQILTSDTLILENLRSLSAAQTMSPAEDSHGLIQPPSKEEILRVGEYQDRLNVSRIGHTNLISVKFTNRDPEFAAQFTNGLVRTYIEQNFRTKFESTRQVSGWLSAQLDELKAKTEAAQAKLANFQKRNGILGIDDKQNIVTQKLGDLNKDLTIAEDERIRAEALYRASLSGDLELVPGASESSVIKSLKEQQAQVADNLAKATTDMGPAHPKVVTLKNQMKQINSMLETELQKIQGRNLNAYVIAQKREKMLRAALDAQKQTANQLNERAVEYETLKHEVQSSQQLYDSLSQRLKEAGVSAGLRSGNIRVVDYARPPLTPSVPNIPLNLGAGLLLGIIGGCVLAFIQERLDTRLRSPDEIEGTAALPLIGVVPRVKTPERRLESRHPYPLLNSNPEKDPTVLTEARPSIELMESFRALRMALFDSSDRPPQVIVVTSALPSEGKTTTSVNCAVVLAQCGKPVLLADADLRAPRVGKLLGIKSSEGLAALLEGKGDSGNLIKKHPYIPGLYILPAGVARAEPASLLDTGCLKQTIHGWKQLYAHIIIDTPPLLSFSDALILSVMADSVLLTVSPGYTPRSALLRARDLLRGVNAKLAGVVVIGVDESFPEFRLYSYCGYGYDHYEGIGKGRTEK